MNALSSLEDRESREIHLFFQIYYEVAAKKSFQEKILTVSVHEWKNSWWSTSVERLDTFFSEMVREVRRPSKNALEKCLVILGL